MMKVCRIHTICIVSWALFKVQGFRSRGQILRIVENQLETNVEYEMVTGFTIEGLWDFWGYRESGAGIQGVCDVWFM